MSPHALNLVGATQVEIYAETVDDMVKAIQIDAGRFWRQSLLTDGPIEIWEVSGLRYLSNGNHRYQAALLTGVDIPEDSIVLIDKSLSLVVTFRFDQMIWLQGHK